jgi:hypothetical protein
LPFGFMTKLCFQQKLKLGKNIMVKKSTRKRPCCICRKWFQPDVRQKERQKTCGRPSCKKEHHRRHCAKWNKRNKEYFINNYLEKKIEQIEAQLPEKTVRSTPEPSSGKAPPFTPSASSPVLPCEVIVKEYGVRSLVIIHYLIRQIVIHTRSRSSGFP